MCTNVLSWYQDLLVPKLFDEPRIRSDNSSKWLDVGDLLMFFIAYVRTDSARCVRRYLL
jgi:hypothetical protein